MVETFALTAGGAERLATAADLAAASAALPDGAYTTLRTYEGDGVPHLGAHARRLEESAALQGRPAVLDRTRMRSGLGSALKQTRFAESRIRITFAPPELFVAVEPFTELPEAMYDDGVACVTVPLRRELPQAKDTRFLGPAQSALRALPPGTHEGLLLGEDGALLEGLSSNVFVVLDGVLRTEEGRALRGTTRALVLELARGLLPVHRDAVTKAELPRASEAFLTSVSREVLPVVRVDDIEVGHGRPGPLARELRARYRARMKADAEHLLGKD
jgi:branched-chain amino acid aminotransferase